ncbi:hypothetical protein [Jidongwangia harbinensis]|uniref:hypothetical protein n=1 Tax=Jidongwangia harbinensis TaxID=2878561 RepID=UPI001CD957DB|nr:hypothetical protein [Jidongwangia harbinensis]MCA2216228.1 hypothetical protein [Jidongwangia harbinensis]
MTVQQAVRGAIDGASGETVEVKAAAVAAAATAASRIPEPPKDEVGVLWRILATALSVVLVVALAGIVWTVVDGKDNTSPDVLVTVFSSALTGFLGLFVKSPA